MANSSLHLLNIFKYSTLSVDGTCNASSIKLVGFFKQSYEMRRPVAEPVLLTINLDGKLGLGGGDVLLLDVPLLVVSRLIVERLVKAQVLIYHVSAAALWFLVVDVVQLLFSFLLLLLLDVDRSALVVLSQLVGVAGGLVESRRRCWSGGGVR